MAKKQEGFKGTCTPTATSDDKFWTMKEQHQITVICKDVLMSHQKHTSSPGVNCSFSPQFHIYYLSILKPCSSQVSISHPFLFCTTHHRNSRSEHFVTETSFCSLWCISQCNLHITYTFFPKGALTQYRFQENASFGRSYINFILTRL